eukprot:2716327-Alexandrium_andersonii.AAC.1
MGRAATLSVVCPGTLSNSPDKSTSMHEKELALTVIGGSGGQKGFQDLGHGREGKGAQLQSAAAPKRKGRELIG